MEPHVTTTASSHRRMPWLVLVASVALASLTACDGSGGSAGAAETRAPGSTSAPSGAPAVGGVCSNEGEQTGMQNGTLQCTAGPSGLTWQALTGSGPNDPKGGSASADAASGASGPGASGRVGESCETDGSFSFGDGLVTVCEQGRYRYAVQADVPAPPAGGTTSRPSWYPTLGQIFGPKVDECSGGSVRFTHSIVEASKLSRSMPGGMMIGDHVTPIDHMYVGISALDKPESQQAADAAVLTAPADGTVIEVSSLGSPTSNRIVIVHGCGIVSVFMVVNRLSGVLASYADQVSSKGFVSLTLPVRAGDEIGTQTSNPIDFNVFDASTWLRGLANPFSYAEGEPWKPYTADPFPLFDGGAGDALRSSIQRTAEPRWGVIDRDVVGTAAGSWFIDGTIGYGGMAVEEVRSATAMIPTGSVSGKASYAWGHLSISPHPVDERAWIFSTGWWSDPKGDPKQAMIGATEGVTEPDELRASDGPVVYPLVSPSVEQPPGFVRPAVQTAPDGIGYSVVPGEQIGWAVVQVIDDATLAVEVITDLATKPAGFGPGKRTYHR